MLFQIINVGWRPEMQIFFSCTVREREIKEEGLRREERVRLLLKHFTSISAPRQQAQSFLHINTSGMRLH